jgi:PAS domain S-box-containing protein
LTRPEQYPLHFFFSEAERLLLASHLLNFGVWEFDFVNTRLVWDDKMFDIYGVNKVDFHHQMEDFTIRVHPEDITEVEHTMQEIIHSHTPLFEQFRIVRPNGDIRIIAGNIKCIRNANNKPIRLIGINHDITEKQILQEKLELQNSELKKIAWMQSHEIRKPVANIIGLIQLYELKKNELSDLQLLPYLKTSARELDMMIKSIIERTKSAEL